jgi:HSP20 family molecular chaperone IbpA
MKGFNFLDTKFLAINGDLTNTVSGGTAALQNQVHQERDKVIIQAKLPTINNRYLTVEVIDDNLVISASVQSIGKSGVVFNMPFGAKAFQLPSGINATNIKAYEHNGFLVVEVPKKPGRNSTTKRNIDINFDDEF